MSSVYPTSLDSFTTKVDSVDYPKALDINDVQDAIENIEAKLGVDDSTDETSIDYMSKHTPVRSKFTYNGGSTTYTIKISPGVYYCKEKYCFWTTELTSLQIPSPAANTWYYFYLDYSSITSSTELTNTNFYWFAVGVPCKRTNFIFSTIFIYVRNIMCRVNYNFYHTDYRYI